MIPWFRDEIGKRSGKETPTIAHLPVLLCHYDLKMTEETSKHMLKIARLYEYPVDLTGCRLTNEVVTLLTPWTESRQQPIPNCSVAVG